MNLHVQFYQHKHTLIFYDSRISTPSTPIAWLRIPKYHSPPVPWCNHDISRCNHCTLVMGGGALAVYQITNTWVASRWDSIFGQLFDRTRIIAFINVSVLYFHANPPWDMMQDGCWYWILTDIMRHLISSVALVNVSLSVHWYLAPHLFCLLCLFTLWWWWPWIHGPQPRWLFTQAILVR